MAVQVAAFNVSDYGVTGISGAERTTAWIDAKRSGITKNDLEGVLCELKLPVLVFSERYRDISGFSFVVDHHFTYLPSTLALA